MKLDPESAFNYGNRSQSYLNVNRLKDAKAAAQEGLARNPGAPLIHQGLYLVDFLLHDIGAMSARSPTLMGKPGFEDLVLYYHRTPRPTAGSLSGRES